MTASGECDECERGIHPHEGPATPRKFDYPAREIARALIAVGSGTSYRRAGFETRARSNRLRVKPNGYPRRNDDGNAVADWVEVFAPVIHEGLANTSTAKWPKIVALDAAPFKVEARNAKGHPKQGGQPSFHVLAAYGWDTKGAGRLIALHAAPGFEFRKGTPYWANFLDELTLRYGGGMPEQIVCDADADIREAVELIWPLQTGSPVAYTCHWHLKNRLLEILRQAGLAASDPLYVAAGEAFHYRKKWDDFVALAQQAKIKQLATWLNRWQQQIEWQLAHQTGRIVSVGPLEQALTVIRSNLSDRRGCFRNRERLNRLLMLMQLDINKQASERAYAKLIRHELLDRGGYSPPRRLILDPRGSKPSLAL